ncbi:MerR family transcriptional regulator [Streptococcus pneumoniae]|uniref:MerR family transcriptional regulator n=1 Tax=Streptococcus pneumoniae TaxID=1313 RepID=UPI000768E594|nr:MerR family transcriptional regulator [Streptococcus pneumoniae]CYK98855.1 MerR family transcriptional regulator [Streptococcus pneumoniae]VFH43403.1 MerR family transcriptional regulator [Streptococcus pneumoniae]VJF27839.1 MerR family transcriptional regulator [Streptococcus pneumoniae]VJH52164.1 MerR family transcriptional regulator [Streptococcus pneumoniae]VJQ41784.1 MerR family transcriptional regulator [Streptococcus pneumoniae]
MYHIKEAAQLSGVSVKTLHHYDKIGLLVPLKSEKGYRTYSQEDLERLQVILYYKYLGFSLEKIAELLKEERTDLLPHLTRQLDYLTRERQHLDTLISTLQKTIQEQKGERKMTIEEKFTGFSYQDNQKYHQEAVEKYGQEVMGQALERQKGHENEATAAFNQVFQTLAQNLQAGLPATATENQEQAAKLLQAIRTYGFDGSIEVFGHIGKGYVYNPEFKENIDKFGSGTAQYTSDAIAAYVQTNAEKIG